MGYRLLISTQNIGQRVEKDVPQLDLGDEFWFDSVQS